MNIALLANWHAVTLPLASDMTNASCNAKAYTAVVLILSTKKTQAADVLRMPYQRCYRCSDAEMIK